MGRVAVTMNVFLESPETDAEEVERKIRKKIKAEDTKINDVAFGLKMIEVLVVFDDKEGGNTEEMAEKIKEIDGVREVESGEATLI